MIITNVIHNNQLLLIYGNRHLLAGADKYIKIMS